MTNAQATPSEKTATDSPTSTEQYTMITPEVLADILEERYGDPARFVKNIRFLMGQNNVTQVALASELGLDITNVNRWLNGRIIPSMRNMVLLDVSIERIISRKEANAS